MMPTGSRHGVLLLATFHLSLGAASSGAASYSWDPEKAAGNFDDPQNWHGPEFPARVRFPAAGDDASLEGSPLVRITGEQATDELVVGHPTLDISGTYRVNTVFGLGSPLTVQGAGSWNVQRWQLGALSRFDSGHGTVEILEPLSASPPSEIHVLAGGELTSSQLTSQRGSLKATISGAGSRWTHSDPLPYAWVVLRSGGLARFTSVNGAVIDAEGAGATMEVAGRFRGYGRCATGALWSCGEALQDGQNVLLDGGQWRITGIYQNQGTDLEIRNGGRLEAATIEPGQFTSVTLVTGAGSQLEAHLLNRPRGTLTAENGGELSFGTAVLGNGGLIANTNGRIEASEIFNNGGVSVLNGGQLTAGDIFLADEPARFGILRVVGAASRAEIFGALAVGQQAEGELVVQGGAQASAGLAGFGLSSTAVGRGTLEGAGSLLELQPAAGSGALLLGDEGQGELQVRGGAHVRVSAAGDVILGRARNGSGRLVVSGFNSSAAFSSSPLRIGAQGTGTLQILDGGGLTAARVTLGQSPADNSLTVDGSDSFLVSGEEIVVGERGRGRLAVTSGGRMEGQRLVVGRESMEDNRVVIRGPGTRVEVPRADIGQARGRAALEVGDRAVLSAPSLSVGIYDGSDATLTVDQAGGVVGSETIILGGGTSSISSTLLRRGGRLASRDVLMFAQTSGSTSVDAAGEGTQILAERDLDIGFAQAGGPAELTIGDGAVLQVGTNLFVGRNGSLTALAGRVRVGNVDLPPVGTVRVGSGGSLRGNGRVTARVEVVGGGRLRPGASPGQLTVAGDLVLGEGSRSELEISGSTAGQTHDTVEATGRLTFGGTLRIEFIDGFAPRAGQTFGLFNGTNGASGAFAAVEITGVAAGFQHRLDTDTNGRVRLVALNNGVPTTAPVLEWARNGAGLQLSWSSSGSWILESSTALPGAWLPVPGAPTLDGDRYRMTVPTTGPGAVFRLRP